MEKYALQLQCIFGKMVWGDKMDILSELWYGNIYPCEQNVNRDEAYFAALKNAIEKKEALYTSLSPELRAIVDQVMDAQMEAGEIAEREAFSMGFRLAVQLLVAGLRDRKAE